jgi:hypothetical protein
VNDGEVACVPERLDGLHGRMEAEESVEVEDGILRDSDAGAQVEIGFFAMGDDDVESVGGSALEDDDEFFALGLRGGGLGEDGAGDEAGHGGSSDDGHGAVFHEGSAR